MSILRSHILTAEKIILGYKGNQPFSQFLKGFFAADKKYGSRDRRSIANLCYNYFRLGKAKTGESIHEKILTGIFLCNQEPVAGFELEAEKFRGQLTNPLIEKMAFAGISATNIFPFEKELSPLIDREAFGISFLQQPHLFLRIRPGKEKNILQKLDDAGIHYHKQGVDCIETVNATNLEKVIIPDQDAVIQDYNSQKVLDFLLSSRAENDKHQRAWDCCTGSGGKAILLFDRLNGDVDLTLTDKRKSILVNLENRLNVAKIKGSEVLQMNLEKEPPSGFGGKFNIIICDAPCTGSGTWSRTPEQLAYFDQKDLPLFSERQRKIISHSFPLLKEGGLFFYITCSVFQEENEGMVEFILSKFPMKLLQMKYLEGYKNFADTLFVAVFTNK